MEGEVRERSVKGRSAIGSPARVMRGRNVSMEVKGGLRDGRRSKRESCER